MKSLVNIFLIVVLSFSYTYGQCPFGGNDTGTIVTPTNTNQFTGSFRGGEYFRMNVVAGGFYTVSTLGLSTWDTQLTIHDTSANFIDFNDDFGGTTQSEISFISPITGQVRILLNQSNCQSTNGGTRTQVRFRGSSTYLTVSDVTVTEEDGTASFTVTYNGGNTSPFTVDYATTDGTAVTVFDYIATNGTLSFTGTAGQSQIVTVNLIDNSFGENSENFFLVLSNTTNGVDIANFGTATIIDGDPPIPNDVPLTLYDDLSGSFDYSVAGGSFRTQSNTVDPCSISTTSSGLITSTIPAGSSIKKAYLYWSHSNPNPDNFVTFEGQSVEADLIYGALFTNRQFYGYIAEVTDIVDDIADPTTNIFDVTDLNIDNGSDYCSSATVLGAWSLMIFYEEDSLPASTLQLYYGFDITQNAGTSFTLENFFAISPTGSKATFLSYEGDATLDGSSAGSTNPEELSITNQLGLTTVLSGDGGQTGNNAYNSTIYDGISGVNNSGVYGLDLDTYDISSLIINGDTQVTANVDVGQDLVISSAVLLKVPSNLISGTVFEDVNYPGGDGRNEINSAGIAISGATVELYDSLGTLSETAITNSTGDYAFGGMPNGTYSIRVINSSVVSNREGGAVCVSCYPIQTFRTSYDGTTLNPVINEVGGANPSGTDTGEGILLGAQSVSSIVIAFSGIGNIDFGYNFNTIVNTNFDGQGSLQQFIVNSNALGNTGLDIEANSIFDPKAGEDVSIFMIPPSGDAQGRVADTNYASGRFDIFIPNTSALSIITDDTTSIDGRTQTAYSGNTNTGTTGLGGSTVGVSEITLPNYDNPEIQIHRNAGDVIRIAAQNTIIRNVSVYANNNAGIRLNSGSALVTNNIIGVNALGNNSGNIDFGVEVVGGEIVISDNYIATTSDAGILINGGTGTLIQGNHITENGTAACFDNIKIQNGSGITIAGNLIEKAGALGIDADGYAGNLIINENTILTSGQNGGLCAGFIANAGIKLDGNNSTISKNIIASNGGSGIVVSGGNTSGNLISQNSIYANGTASPALGIDLDLSDALGDGVTLNDSGDSDIGPNGLLNFPIISGAFMSGGNLVVEGWSRPGATIEIFLTDVNQGTATEGDNQLGLSTDYGEGQVYIGTVTEGSAADLFSMVTPYTDLDSNTDNTNKFKFVIPMSLPISVGNYITSTATLSNSTSEFSPFSMIENYTVITNRRITYRIKKN